MSALLGWFLSNPTILAILAGFIGALGWGFKQRLAGAQAERNKQRAKDADSYEQHLKELAAAADAHPIGSVLEDPRNRDNR